MKYKYETRGTCSRAIVFDIEGDTIRNIEFYGGCPGNLQAISKAMEGKTVEEIENLFKDIKCGSKPTSCSAELAKAVRKAYEETKK